MRSSARRFLVVFAVAGLAGSIVPAATAQVRFRVTVEEVLVDVVVTRRNRPVADLTAGDFTLLDGGDPREVRLVPLGELPVSVLFVMDLSPSVTEERQELLADAARRFAGQLSARDRCAVLLFASEPTLTHDFAHCAELPANPFGGDNVLGGTALWDAVMLSTALVEEESGRAVVIIFTDGEDTLSWTPEGFVEPALRGSKAVLYAVIPPDARGTARQPHRFRNSDLIPPSVARRRRIGIRRLNGGVAPHELAALLDGPRRNRRPREGYRAFSELQLLRHAAQISGGRMVRSRDEQRLGAAYEEILEEMRSRYVLAFVPDPGEPPGWRRLDVRVEGADVRARRGYLHQPGAAAPPGR